MTTKITKPLMSDDSVGTDQIEDRAVNADKLALDGVEQQNIAPSSIGWDELADEAVTSPKYAVNSLPITAVPDDLLTTPKYKDLSVTTAKLDNESVTTAKLGANAVTNSKLGLASVDTVNMVAGSATSSIIGNASVITDKIANNAVTYAKLQQADEGTMITFDDSSTAYGLPIGSEGQLLTITNGRPAWGGTSIPTGTIIDYFGTAAPTGWMAIDGSSIGSAASAADFPSDDTEQLYYHLWNNFADSMIAVSSGRGLSAGDDWDANKTMTLPDLRGRICVGVDDSEAPVGLITTSTFSSVSTVGTTGGTEKVTLTEGNLPDHRHHMFRAATSTNPSFTGQPSTIPTSTVNERVSRWDGNISNELNHQHSYRMYYNNAYIEPTAGMTSSPVSTAGSSITTGVAHSNMQPSILVLKLIKL